MAKLNGLRLGACGVLCAGLLVVGTQGTAQTVTTQGGAGTIDCTNVTIDYVDDPNLTEAEKLARMDEAFQRSLSKFDLCQTGQYSGQQSGAETTSAPSGQTDGGQDAGSPARASASATDQTQSDAAAKAAAEAEAEAQAAADAAAEAQANSQANSQASSQAPAGSSWGPPPDAPSATPADTPPPQDSQTPTDTASAPPGQGTAGTPSSATSDLSGAGVSGGGTDPSAQNPEPGSEGNQGVSQGSVASSDMTGTELPPVAPPAPPAPSLPGTQDTASVDPGVPGAPSPGEATGSQQQSSNGAVPEDIPPADNDGVLEAQIRKAAINEKDPAVKKKLWNEYRKYKGLPTVN